MGDAENALYAEAMFSVASAEGDPAAVADELFSFGQTLRSNDDLRTALADRSLPVERRIQVVEDLLEGKASSTTTALVSMVVGAGRGADLPAICTALVERTAAAGNRSVAEVRTAIPLTDDQRTRLASALSERTGKDIEVKAIVDPSVKGGVIAQIGDLVVDGSVRRKLALLRESF
jgi:F-type H+-transporting ATPase subunit delta